MNKFAYQMQNILEIKSQMEEQEKINFATKNQKLTLERQKLMEVTLRKSNYEKKARDLVNGTLDIQEIRHCKHAIDAMKSVVRTQMIAVHVAEKNVEAARLQLNTVMKERKMHEKLREHAFETYMKDYEAEERKEIDEITTFNYCNNQ